MSKLWTPEMDNRLIKIYPHFSNKELSAMTGWKVKQMTYRAGLLKLKKQIKSEALPVTKPEWLEDKENFLKTYYNELTNPQLAKCLGMSLQSIRNKCYELGLLRMRLEYWTEEQIQYLKENFQTRGDKELAEMFAAKWHKEKGWSFKHIEKKRLYLKLKRTKEELQAIQDRNVETGRFANCPVGRWLKYGVSKDGEIRMWRSQSGRYVPFIKIAGKFTHWARYAWTEKHGAVPEGLNIVFADNDPYNISVDNLIAITDAELSRRNSAIASGALSDNYIAGLLSHGRPDLREAMRNSPDIIELKREQIKLNRAINHHETTGN